MSNASRQAGCVFCLAVENPDQPDSLVIHRGTHNFVIINRYPYNNGHIMIAPYLHISNPVDSDAATLEEMMRLFQRGITALRDSYEPDGFNMGMNLGKCAGAGIEAHYHLHLVPRWLGDTNFMTALADIRVIPEDFSVTIAKLKPHFSV